ncbi:LEM domain-containing protein 1 isoform X2 [Hypomesus transpacificus]|uniref:LEM domain-containing protein 1 isoform X2 n=1 Tax=Hypomesus transpacificus TaxID=137520 RepID=UPI001F083A5D|nr:LEM domain-containing protein 1 isoform X2 [Hypomesus transpacificus]
MPVFVEDPAQFSKQRLKSELVANNITLPDAESKKQVYLDLYFTHIGQKRAADFSSDEDDDQVQDVGEEEKTEDSEMLDSKGLTDDELKASLLKHGVRAGPIVASTRALYERKLEGLLQPASQPKLNGTGDTGQYSDSEEEEDISVSEQAGPETVSHLDQNQQEDRQTGLNFQNGDTYPQCFMQSSRLRARKQPGRWKSNPRRNARNVVEWCAEWGQDPLLSPLVLSKTSVGQPKGARPGVLPQCGALIGNREDPSSSSSQTFSITQMVEEIESRCSLSTRAERERGNGGSDMERAWPRSHREPITDVLMEIFPDTEPTPTGIVATRRRPIKGAAGRPVQFKYPDTPLSPTTMERQELERFLVPLWVQVVAFLSIVCLLYLIYACVEDSLDNPFGAFLENLSLKTGDVEVSLETGVEERLLLKAEPADTQVLDPLTGQE